MKIKPSRRAKYYCTNIESINTHDYDYIGFDVYKCKICRIKLSYNFRLNEYYYYTIDNSLFHTDFTCDEYLIRNILL